MKKLTVVFITALTLLISCKKDKDKVPSGSSRAIRYEITGNFTGTLFVSYTTAAGGIATDQITLPWNKEVTYASSVTAANIAFAGNGGVSGQKITVVIKRGGTQVGSPIEIPAQSTGSFSEAAPPIVF